MGPQQAANLLDLPVDATPEQLEARFLELRTRLEDKIAKAPTPGLKAKYRESLEQITSAFETLTLAADSSALPVLQKQSAVSSQPSAANATPVGGVPSSREASRSSPPPKKSGGREFLIVAFIAVAVLGAGGWFVMKTRAENERKARIAAETRAEADRQAEEKARSAAEAKAGADRQAEAVRKNAETEKAREEQVLVQIRTQVAEAKIVWEVAEREERDAERRLGELRSELRGLRDAKPETVAELSFRLDSAQRYANWLRDYLLQHPVKLARARVEELMHARALGDITPAAEELQRIVKGLQENLTASRNGEGTFVLASNLPTLKWELRDSLGRVQRGRGPERVTGLAFATYELTYHALSIVDEKKAVIVAPGRTSSLTLDFDYRSLEIKNLPADARITIAGQAPDLLPEGRIPVSGAAHLVAHRPGHLPAVHTSEPPNATAEFTWVPLNPPALVEAFLAGLPKHSPADRLTLLSMLETSLEGTTLLPAERWLQLFEDAETVLAGESDPVKRLDGYITLARELYGRDDAAAAAALEQTANAMAKLEVTQRRKLQATDFQTAAWELAPAAGRKFFQLFEAALAPDARRLPIFSGYLFAGATAQADQTEQAALADATTPALRERTANEVRNRRDHHAAYISFTDPLRRALCADDVAAFNRLAASGIPSNQVNFRTLIRTLCDEGLYNQAVEMLALTNFEKFDDHMVNMCQLTGRLDLLERLVISQRAHKNSNLSWLALRYAMAGNRTKTRAMLALLEPDDHFTQLVELGARATALEMIGDRKASIEILDRAEKHPKFTKGDELQSYDLSGLLIATRRQGDDARQRRILERYQKPEELLAWTNLWSGDLAGAKAETLRTDNLPERRIAEAYQYFYEDWLSVAELKDRDLPVWARPGCAEGLMLAYLNQSKSRGRANASRFTVPYLQSVAPYVKKQEVYYFPTAASSRGLKTGKAVVQVNLDAAGKPTGYTTLETTDPVFAEELTRSMATWTFLPALKLGTPVPGTYSFTGTFNLAP